MMNYYFYYTTSSPDTWERGTLEWGTRERGTGERGIREKGFSDGVKNTPSRIAPGSIRATTGENGQPHVMAPRVPFARTFEAHLEAICARKRPYARIALKAYAAALYDDLPMLLPDEWLVRYFGATGDLAFAISQLTISGVRHGDR